MHNFWLGVGIGLLIFGDGVLTLVGGLMGIPTIVTLFVPFNPSAIPNLLQSAQLTFLVLGLILAFAGMA